MSAPGTPRPGGRAEELRGYLQAAGDLSAIARARLTDSVLEALRGEVEKAGSALGLAGVEEVARLRRTVERLERRVQALEGGSAATTRSTGRPPSRGGAGPRGPGSRGPGRGPDGGPLAGPEGPAGSGGPAAPSTPPDGDVLPPTRRAPVRRPRPAEVPTAPGAGPVDPGALDPGPVDEGPAATGRGPTAP